MSLFYLSGTSMASPHVAGIVALMAQQNSGLTAPQADEPEQQCWDTDATGSGFITATAALDISEANGRKSGSSGCSNKKRPAVIGGPFSFLPQLELLTGWLSPPGSC